MLQILHSINIFLFILLSNFIILINIILILDFGYMAVIVELVEYVVSTYTF